MSITIETMCEENLKEIFEFELKGRSYFENVLPPRPPGYFEYDTFKKMMNDILQEQLLGECFMCIIRDQSGKMVGRVNLGSIKNDEVVRADLGYRIAEVEQGKGYASDAVNLIIREAVKKFSINVFVAGTAVKNYGSQKVLIKNGFTQVGEKKNVVKINNEWIDGLLFEKRIE